MYHISIAEAEEAGLFFGKIKVKTWIFEVTSNFTTQDYPSAKCGHNI